MALPDIPVEVDTFLFEYPMYIDAFKRIDSDPQKMRIFLANIFYRGVIWRCEESLGRKNVPNTPIPEDVDDYISQYPIFAQTAFEMGMDMMQTEDKVRKLLANMFWKGYDRMGQLLQE